MHWRMCASLTWVLSSDFKEAIVSSLSLICFCSSSISFFSSAICFNKSFSLAYIRYITSLKPVKYMLRLWYIFKISEAKVEIDIHALIQFYRGGKVVVNSDVLNENVISWVKSWIWSLLGDIPQFLFRAKLWVL